MSGLSADPRVAAAIDELADALVAALADRLERERETAPPPGLVSLDSARRRLGIGRTALYSMLARGELRTVMLGRRRLVPSAELDRIADGT